MRVRACGVCVFVCEPACVCVCVVCAWVGRACVRACVRARGSPSIRYSLFHPPDSLFSSWDNSEEDTSSCKQADITADNSPLTRVYAAFLNRFRTVPTAILACGACDPIWAPS